MTTKQKLNDIEKLAQRTDLVYNAQLYELQCRLEQERKERRYMHQNAVIDVRNSPLRLEAGLEWTIGGEKVRGGAWWELTKRTSAVTVRISSNVSQEDAIKGLEKILEELKSHPHYKMLFYFGDQWPDETDTDDGPVLALPEDQDPPRLVEDGSDLPF